MLTEYVYTTRVSYYPAYIGRLLAILFAFLSMLGCLAALGISLFELKDMIWIPLCTDTGADVLLWGAAAQASLIAAYASLCFVQRFTRRRLSLKVSAKIRSNLPKKELRTNE